MKKRFMAVVLLLAMGMSLFSGCGIYKVLGGEVELEVVGTEKRFLKILEEIENQQLKNIVYDGMAGGIMTNTAAAPAAEAVQSSKAADDFSTTNVQVEGVDEADLIKTDGAYIYYVVDGTLYIVAVAGDGGMELMHAQTFENFIPYELYLDDEYLIVIGYKIVFNGTSREQWYYNTKEYVAAQVYALNSRSDIEKVREVSLEGNYLSSRKIGKSLYLITSQSLWGLDKAPVYKDSAVSGNEIKMPFDKMYVISESEKSSLIAIATVDLSDVKREVDIHSFIGTADTTYMSLENLYLATQRYGWSSHETKIYKFTLKADSIEFTTTGKVPGWIINQFALDEHNGYLRIATTDYNANNLYILDSELEKVGEITDIAPGERIYSVRFLGAKGYVVTFKQTDPLFAFDLSDPENPKLLGALKIPGYSTYLHPYDENHLIGFGQDTEMLKNGAVIATGLKMSMFDITDMTNPLEMFVAYIGDRGSTSPLLTNHKAILQSTEKDIFAFPAYEMKVPEGYDPTSYGTLERQGAFVYSIDMEEGFNLRGVISHTSPNANLKAGYYDYASVTDVERIIYIGDFFYTISADRIQSNRIDTLEAIGTVKSLR